MLIVMRPSSNPDSVALTTRNHRGIYNHYNFHKSALVDWVTLVDHFLGEQKPEDATVNRIFCDAMRAMKTLKITSFKIEDNLYGLGQLNPRLEIVRGSQLVIPRRRPSTLFRPWQMALIARAIEKCDSLESFRYSKSLQPVFALADGMI
jgi:hypothetical protein